MAEKKKKKDTSAKDLDQKERELTESLPDKETVELEGFTYTVDFDKLMDLDMIELLMGSFEGDKFKPDLPVMMAVLKTALGDDYEKFKKDQRELHGKASIFSLVRLFSQLDLSAAVGN